MTDTEAQRRAKAKYAREKVKALRLAFYRNNPEDAELLAWMESQPNMTGYLKQLIRQDMERSQDNS
ncbi:hypothetical protein AAK684_03285 [Leptogranulimonas caecicola]|uniref:Uncharacterized protein n=1 Tax=Leptogranulimonas caecicola TaxID=2894156 RepID=A0AAU9D8F7_9ACTN|nr:hypothetical protein [Leptogranulimonas caecicola]BDC91384.1 hypothetical protein ATTO_12560 [Leptogranulimonas caecicola]